MVLIFIIKQLYYAKTYKISGRSKNNLQLIYYTQLWHRPQDWLSLEQHFKSIKPKIFSWKLHKPLKKRIAAFRPTLFWHRMTE